MKRERIVLSSAALVVGLLVLASNASATLTYIDATIRTYGKTPANTVQCDPSTEECVTTPFTADPVEVDENGNWATGDSGDDGLWRERPFGNYSINDPADPRNRTIYESRGQGGVGGQEDPAVLQTTANIPVADQGTEAGVYVLFWGDGSAWQIAACLECVEDEKMPNYVFNPESYPNAIFGVTDSDTAPGAGQVQVSSPGSADFIAAEGNRTLKAAWIGNVTLDSTLTVYVGDGPAGPLNDHNHRAWYDGIAYGDVQDLPYLGCNVPEPASLILFGIAFAGLGLVRRRRR